MGLWRRYRRMRPGLQMMIALFVIIAIFVFVPSPFGG
jgi:hypothetical protein